MIHQRSNSYTDGLNLSMFLIHRIKIISHFFYFALAMKYWSQTKENKSAFFRPHLYVRALYKIFMESKDLRFMLYRGN